MRARLFDAMRIKMSRGGTVLMETTTVKILIILTISSTEFPGQIFEETRGASFTEF